MKQIKISIIVWVSISVIAGCGGEDTVTAPEISKCTGVLNGTIDTLYCDEVYRRNGGDDFIGNAVWPAGVSGEVPSVDGFVLNQNIPNPFDSMTSIYFTLSTDTHVSLKICDFPGREVRALINQALVAGVHQVVWGGCDSRGNDVSSGVYFCHMTVGNETATRMLLLVR